jgi:hypothetical protein
MCQHLWQSNWMLMLYSSILSIYICMYVNKRNWLFHIYLHMVDLKNAKYIRTIQKKLSILPTTIIQVHQYVFHVDMWNTILKYMTWWWLRCTCTSSKTIWNIGKRFHPHTLEGPILGYLRKYQMVFLPSIRLQIKVDHDSICIDPPKHGCRELLRCCAWTRNGLRCRNMTGWDGCYGPLCSPHRFSLGIVADGGQYKNLDCEWHLYDI